MERNDETKISSKRDHKDLPGIDSSDDEADLKRCRAEKQQKDPVESEDKEKDENDEVKETEGAVTDQTDQTESLGNYACAWDKWYANFDPWAPENQDRFGFCCSNCECSSEKVARYFEHFTMNTATSGNSQLYHRGCCHTIKKTDPDYKSEMQKAIDEGSSFKKARVVPPKPISHLRKSYNSALAREARENNMADDVATDSVLYTNEVYVSYCAAFQKRKKEDKLKALKVLDIFCGIGSGTLVLKKLKIPLDTVVHVDHDPVARYVNEYHHKNSDDGIKHIYKESFEEIYGDDEMDINRVEKLIKEHGPFDLLLAAAPCQGYSMVNGFRELNPTGKYLRNVGKLIQQINLIQKRNNSEQHPLLFVSENVKFEADKVNEVSDCYEGLPPFRRCASDFSPCKRDRLYWINIPIDAGDTEEDQILRDVSPSLDCGYIMPALVLRKEGETNIPVKANTFMASKTRINDDRMIKVRKLEGTEKYILDHFSVEEREKMLGLPVGYVSTPLQQLFKTLTEKAFIYPEMTEGLTWKESLPEDLWHFKNCKKYEFKSMCDAPPYFQIGISAPLEAKKPSVYNEEEYCKHLIGNGWSIPVVEHILSGLVNICEERLYDGCDYDFPWPPHNCKENVQEAETADI